jgi:hypothetical protein
MERQSPRQIVSVDLGDLAALVADAAKAANVGRSTWLKDLARRELGAAPHPANSDADADSTLVYRPWLSAAATAKLDLIVATNGFRNRTAAIRAVLDGVAVASESGPAALADAVQALGRSNHGLVEIRQRLAAVGARPGVRAEDSAAIAIAITDMRRHLMTAAVLVGELRPLVKTP